MAQPAEASLATIEPSVDGCTLGHSAVTELFVTAFDMGDEDRLGAIRSTVAALCKEEEELSQRLKDKAVVQKLQDKVDLYMSDLRKAEDLMTAMQTEREAALKKSEADEAALQQQLHSAQEQIQMLTTERNKLAAELATKDIALTDYHAEKVQLVEELVSYRAQTHEMDGTIAAFTEQHAFLTSRASHLYRQCCGLGQRNMSQQASIYAQNQELSFYRMEWARRGRGPPQNMHGPVGGPRANYPQQFFQSYAPDTSVGYGNDPVPTSGPIPGYSSPATDMEQASDDHSMAAAESENVAEHEPGLEKEFSFGHSLPEPEVELGPAFLAKLQNKGVDIEVDTEAAKVAAVHIGLGHAPSPPSHPPVQASRGSRAGGVDTVADVPVATDVPVAGEVSEVAPPPPARRAVYFTPLHPAHYVTMPADEQQTYKEAVERLSRSLPSSIAPSPMAGVYVAPMPPQAHTHSNERQTAGTGEAKEGSSSSSSMPSAKVEESVMGEVKQQRLNRRHGPRGSGRANATRQDSDNAAAGQQTICLSQSKQGQTDASQGTESVEVNARQLVSKSARRRASNNKRKKAQQSTVGSAQ